MRKNIREFLELVSTHLNVKNVIEIGSLQVEGQEDLSNLRPLFPHSTFLGSDIRKGKGVDIIQDAHNLAIKDSSFDLVLCIDTLEHILDPWTAIKEFKRILSESGTLIISSVMDFPIHDYPNDYWRFTPEIFLEFLKDLEYKKVFFQGDFFKPDTLIGIGSRRKLDLEFPRRVANRDLFEYTGPSASTVETKTINWFPPISPAENSIDFLGKLAEEIAKIIPPGAKILDIACSLGPCTDLLLERACSIHGVALDRYTHGSLSSRYTHMISLGEIDQLQDKFDAILMLNIQVKKLFPITRTKKLLKEDGFLILSIPNPFHIASILETLKDPSRAINKLAAALEDLPIAVEDLIRIEVLPDETWYGNLWVQLPDDFKNTMDKVVDIKTYKILIKCRPYDRASYQEHKKDFLSAVSRILREFKRLAHQKDLLEDEHKRVINSRSWRMTEPLRKAKRLIKVLLK